MKESSTAAGRFGNCRKGGQREIHGCRKENEGWVKGRWQKGETRIHSRRKEDEGEFDRCRGEAERKEQIRRKGDEREIRIRGGKNEATDVDEREERQRR